MLEKQIEEELLYYFNDYSKYYEIEKVINKKNIIVRDKYGLLKATFNHLKNKKIPKIGSAINKTEYFKNKMKHIFPNYSNSYSILKVITEKNSKGCNKLRAIISDKYGECSVLVNHLENHKIPTIQTAIDKDKYFNNYLLHKNKYFKENYFKIKTNFVSTSSPVIVETKYGECLVKPSLLLNGHKPTILSAINPTAYFIEKLKSLNAIIFDTIDFKNFVYKTNNVRAQVCCKIHGDFKITPAVLLRGGGCIKCGYEKLKEYKENNITNFSHSSWVEQATKSKNFKSFKVYILKCENGDETFYKIGKTYRDMNKRFYNCNIPYKYQIEKIYESLIDGYEISKLESELKNKNKDYKYVPQLKFGGMYECFKEIKYGL